MQHLEAWRAKWKARLEDRHKKGVGKDDLFNNTVPTNNMTTILFLQNGERSRLWGPSADIVLSISELCFRFSRGKNIIAILLPVHPFAHDEIKMYLEVTEIFLLYQKRIKDISKTDTAYKSNVRSN